VNILATVGDLWVNLGLKKDGFDRGMREVKRETGLLDGMFKNVMSTMAGFGLYDIGSKLVGGLKNAVMAGIDYNATLETSTIKWTTLLGTQEKANKMLKDIEKFAATTPFEKMGVDKMAGYLNNAGFEGKNLFGQLTKFGDIAGAFDIQADSLEEMVRQYSQVQNAGVAYTEDLNIIEDRSVPIMKNIAEVMGVPISSVKKLASEGKITADVYNKSLDNIANKSKGGMNNLSESFNGIKSTIMDSMGQITGILAKPLFDKLKGGAIVVRDALGGITTSLTEDGLMGTIKKYAPSVAPFVQDLGNLIQSTFSRIQGVGKTFQNFWSEHSGLIMGIVKVAWFIIMAIVKSVIDSIIGVVDNGLKLIDGIIDFFSNLFKGNFKGVWEAIKQIFSSGIKFVWHLMNLIFLNNLKGIFTSLKSSAGSILTNAWNGIKSIFSGGIGNVISSVKTMASNILSKFRGINLFTIGKQIIQGLISGIKNMGPNLAGTLGALVNSAITFTKRKLDVRSPSRVFMQIGEYVGEGLAIGVDKSNSMVKKSMTKLNGVVTGMNGSKISPISNSSNSRYNTINGNSTNRTSQIIVPVNLDGREVARVTAPYMNSELNNINKRNNRLGGVIGV
jgi:tape measure domain-containing protein